MVTYMLVGLPEKPAMNHISMALHIFSFPAVSFAVGNFAEQNNDKAPSWQIWVLVFCHC